MQYTIDVNSPFLICRACCHDNTGCNMAFVKKWTPINWFALLKNKKFSYLMKKTPGAFFCDDYDKKAYPRSKAAKAFINTETFMNIVRNSVDSDICRFIIDLDRCLYLREHGYDVMYMLYRAIHDYMHEESKLVSALEMTLSYVFEKE